MQACQRFPQTGIAIYHKHLYTALKTEVITKLYRHTVAVHITKLLATDTNTNTLSMSITIHIAIITS